MEDDDTYDGGIASFYEFTVNIVKLQDRRFIPVSYKFKMEFGINDSVEDFSNIDEHFAKIKYFIDHRFDHSLVISNDDDYAKALFYNQAPANNMVISPFDPDDHVITLLLQSKFEAISNDELVFLSSDVSTNSIRGLSHHIDLLPDSLLPTTKEWFPTPNYFEKPWWKRNDISTVDSMVGEDEDLTDLPDWAKNISFKAEENASYKEIIKKPAKQAFNPTIIKGGKDDNR